MSEAERNLSLLGYQHSPTYSDWHQECQTCCLPRKPPKRKLRPQNVFVLPSLLLQEHCVHNLSFFWSYFNNPAFTIAQHPADHKSNPTFNKPCLARQRRLAQICCRFIINFMYSRGSVRCAEVKWVNPGIRSALYVLCMSLKLDFAPFVSMFSFQYETRRLIMLHMSRFVRV